MSFSIRYSHLILKRQQPVNTCSEEHYCVILQLTITFLHLNTSVTDFISKLVVFIYACNVCNCFCFIADFISSASSFCCGIEVLKLSFQ